MEPLVEPYEGFGVYCAAIRSAEVAMIRLSFESDSSRQFVQRSCALYAFE